MYKIFVLLSVAVVASSYNTELMRHIRSATAVGETKAEEFQANFVWIIKDWSRFSSYGSYVWSPTFEHTVGGKTLRFAIRWLISTYEPARISIYPRHLQKSDYESIRYKWKLTFLSQSNGTAIQTGFTNDFENNVWYNVASDSFLMHYDDFMKVNELFEKLPDREANRDLIILFELWYLTDVQSIGKATIDYLRSADDYITFEQFGRKLLTDGETSDAFITGYGWKNKGIPVHRSFIKVCAPKFYAKLFAKNTKSATVAIEGTSYKIFDAMVKFIYTTEKPSLQLREELQELLLSSIEFGLDELVAVTLNSISRQVQVNNALNWLEFSRKHEIKKLEDFVIDYMRTNAITMGSEKWKNILGHFTKSECKNATVS